MAEESPWLDRYQASELLEREFNIRRAPRTIDNKCYRGDIPSEMIDGERRIHRDALREWARPGKGGE